MKDYYEILGVARDATPNAVKIAYEGRMKKAARLSDKKRAAEERLLNEAYAILSNPAKREHFDSQRLEIDAHLEGSASKMPLVIGIVAVVVTVAGVAVFLSQWSKAKEAEEQRTAERAKAKR